MRIYLDTTELIDPHLVASELLALGADRDDELVTYSAGEPTAFMAGRLADLGGSRSFKGVVGLLRKRLPREQPRDL